MNTINARCARIKQRLTAQNDERTDDPRYEHGEAGVTQGCPWKIGSSIKFEVDRSKKAGCDGPVLAKRFALCQSVFEMMAVVCARVIHGNKNQAVKESSEKRLKGESEDTNRASFDGDVRCNNRTSQ